MEALYHLSMVTVEPKRTADPERAGKEDSIRQVLMFSAQSNSTTLSSKKLIHAVIFPNRPIFPFK